ncbi:hypothetical protein [Pontibacter cellulosilyticus]|uniref:Uncharacterized protein n=1 Tax=Pontibacter cellulosilyticus TaxID=1720253 RepID=A0A923N8D2_9BACT|nr:hypothetical protein [Pontibacter cellulosilyticus]MBC5993629.1 hypothetical protein [Pontibacter cellulosilyticus]
MKRYLLGASIFLFAGGAYALFRELFIQDVFRLGWAVSSILILGAGMVAWLIANNRLATKDAYFSMTPERIKYRLAVFSREVQVSWQDIDALEISAHAVVYHLVSGESITMRLGNIQQPEVVLHVSRSIHLAAMEKGIMVNGVQTSKQNTLV